MTQTLAENDDFELVEVVQLMFGALVASDEGVEVLLADDGGGAVGAMMQRASLE